MTSTVYLWKDDFQQKCWVGWNESLSHVVHTSGTRNEATAKRLDSVGEVEVQKEPVRGIHNLQLFVCSQTKNEIYLDCGTCRNTRSQAFISFSRQMDGLPLKLQNISRCFRQPRDLNLHGVLIHTRWVQGQVRRATTKSLI